MQPVQPGVMCNTVLGILQYAVLVPLAISAALAIWRAVTDYVRGERETTTEMGQGSTAAGG